MQRSLFLLKLAIKKNAGSLSVDNIGIGHLSLKVKLVPSLELFQYNRRAIKNLLYDALETQSYISKCFYLFKIYK